MARVLVAALVVLFAPLVQADDVWQPFVLRAYDGRELQARIAMLPVRENRSAADSRWIRVAVVRIPAAPAAAGAAPIVFLTGGPGVPATALARVPVYFDLFDRLRTVGEVVLIDQRGSGMSLPNLVCPPADIPKDFLATDEAMRQALLTRVTDCSRHLRDAGLDLGGYSTREIAADVDATRRAIGARTVKLLAFSYGSEVAFEILRRRPGSVERVVFASTRGPDTLLKMPSAWDAALGDLLPTAREVVARLDAGPIEVGPFRVGGTGVLAILRTDLPDGRALGKIPELLRDLDLLPRIEPIHNGLSKSFNLMTLAVDCSSGWSAARLAQTEQEARTAVMRTVNLQWHPDICRAIHGRVFPPPPIPPIATRALFITGTRDVNAPPAQTDRLRRHFRNSEHFIVDGAAHETLPMPEVQGRVVGFLVD